MMNHSFKGRIQLDIPSLWQPYLDEQELSPINTACMKSYSNLILEETSALNNLKNIQFIVIKPCQLYNKHKRLPHQNPYKPARPQYIETTSLQHNKCNNQLCMHSHRVYAFPTHN